MTTLARPTPSLSAIVTAVLALALSGCCLGVEDEVYTSEYSGSLSDDELDEVRAAGMNDEERCEAACFELQSYSPGGEINRVLSCSAIGADDALPAWDPAQVEVNVTCEAEFVEAAFCTGRRPQGHREAELAVDSRGAWFALHAHLERAAIAAFVELADWLAARGAPFELVDRCRAAARDEVRHAEQMTALAAREGASVPELEAEPSPDDLLSVALHNAVEGCVSEAFAALIAAHQARSVEAPEHREVFTTVADDELRHGQLAWDIHAWLLDQLSPEQRDQVIDAQSRALADLPSIAAANAARTPTELGWPRPERAAEMARHFARLVRAQSRSTSPAAAA